VRRSITAAGDAQHGHVRFGEELLTLLLCHPSWHVFSSEESSRGPVGASTVISA
jgi:hypothetical protein